MQAESQMNLKKFLLLCFWKLRAHLN